MTISALAIGDAGSEHSPLIDGVWFSIQPSSLSAQPDPVSDYADMMDGGAEEWQRRPAFDGVANHSDRYTIAFPYDSLVGENRVKIERIRARGGTHRLVVWRMEPAFWTCKAGISRYYFPRFRRIAAHVYDGLALRNSYVVGTAIFPTIATLNGVALAVTYAAGPTLADPGDGAIVIAKNPDTSGRAKGYAAFRIGSAVATGDEIELWSVFTHDCSMRSPQIRIIGRRESHSHTFVEI